MENFKVTYFRFEDTEGLLDSIKGVMKTYDMELIESDGTKHTFDRDRSYSRSFIIRPAENGWTAVYDEDEIQADSLSQELSGLLGCIGLCIGIRRDLLFYTLFADGDQVDQYLSTFEYYEYPIDNDVISRYKGNGKAFESVVGQESTYDFQNILDRCKEGELEVSDAYDSILNMIGAVIEQQEEPEDEEESIHDEIQEIIDVNDIFYVDFKSINIKNQDTQKVIEAIEQTVQEMGYIRVESFEDSGSSQKGFFKKLLSSVSESKRLEFYISHESAGWVTLVGELEVLYGNEPTEWQFLDIEPILSQILKQQMITVYGNNERWGFNIYKDGDILYKYTSDSGIVDVNEVVNIFKEMNRDDLEEILNSSVRTVEDIDGALNRFCLLLGIRNYRINIPMDYSEEEYKINVLNRLPDGKEFINIKFIENK